MAENSGTSAFGISEELIDAIRSKKCILLAGPGLSHYARTDLGGSPPRCWKDTLEELISLCWEEDIIDQTQKTNLDTSMSSASLLEAGSKLQDYLKAKDESLSLLQKQLRKIMLCDQAKAGNAHLLLAQIPFRGYCTINYDTFIEDAYSQVQKLHLAMFDALAVDSARIAYSEDRCFILKLLGDIDHPTSLNLGDRYLEKYLKENSKCQEALAKIFARPSILLIGFEQDDLDLIGLTANETIFKAASKPKQYTILVERKSQQSPEGEKITPNTILVERKSQQSPEGEKITITLISYESEAELESILEEILHSLGTQSFLEKKVKSDADAQQSPLQPEKNVRSASRSETEPVHIFISWAPQDQLPKESLVKQLRPLLDNKKISIWAGEELGIDRDLEVHKHLNETRIFLPLISADFFTSEPCISDLGMAINRYMTEKANQRGKMTIRIIPILIRSFSWEDTRIGKLKLQSLPQGGKPVMESEHKDQAFFSIAQEIKKLVEQLSQESDILEESS